MRLPDPRRAMLRAGLRVTLTAFPYVPRPLRRRAVRIATPSFTVGCVLVVTDTVGRVLFLRQRHYGRDLTLPGGLLRRGEAPHIGVAREVREEVGLHTDVLLPATVIVDTAHRRVDLVFTARLVGAPESVRPDRDEATEVCWRSPSDWAEVSDATRVVLDQLGHVRGGVAGTAR